MLPNSKGIDTMITTVEISMYPLRENYVPAIDGLIGLLEERATKDGFEVLVQPTSTLICGDYELVTGAVQECIFIAHQRFGQAVYVTKTIPDYRGI